MIKVVVINGRGGSGKDTFISYCQKHYQEIINISTIDEIKSVARTIGWNGKKDEKGRKLLSEIKRILKEYNDKPYREISKKINSIIENDRSSFLSNKFTILFVHSREPEEIARLVEDFNASTLLVNSSLKITLGNNSDDQVEQYVYDYVIKNDRTKKDLEKEAKSFIKGIVKKAEVASEVEG